ncbi:MAG: hypothetical protein HZA91_11935 [Verrucomicrobia bacterium]|nr:hypothetical protein [Verrucomicrobiota bacterium]
MKPSLALLMLPAIALATEIQKFTKDTYDDFAKGEARGVTITERGELRLAPAAKKLCDLAPPIVWAAARDSQGHVYLGGSDGKVWRVARDGKPMAFFAAKELEIHALAVDSKDNVYAASSPDGKVYRIAPDGKSEVFHDPPDKYIWALQFDRAGNLFVACGGKANIYKVSPTGVAETFFSSDETNIVSLGLDAKGRLLAGSEPNGYLYRIEERGKGFVLFDSPLKELKAIATDGKGYILAIALGESEKPATTPAATPGAAKPTEEKKPARPGELYRVSPDGYAETLWSGKDATAMSLTAAADGAALVGTGDKGVIYRIKSRDEVSTLVKLDGQQVTALLAGEGDSWLAATSNLGALWNISQARATDGAWESEPLDAKLFSTWGVARAESSAPAGGRVVVSSRSGNTEKPEKTWSDWAEAEAHGTDFALKSPASRYVQVRVKLAGADGKHAPVVDRLEVYYTPRNVAPQISKLIVFDGGYGFQRIQQPEPPQQTTVDLVIAGGTRRDPMDATRKQRLQIQPQAGIRAARWTASDANLDPLNFDIYLRAEGDPTWKLLAEKSSDFFFAWDTRSFADGLYRLKVTATDAPGNPAGKGLGASIESAAFAVDNTPPAITVQSAKRDADGALEVKFTVSDALTPIASVEVSGDGKDWFPVFAGAQQAGARRQELTARIAGAKSAFIRARDEAGNIGAATATLR